MPIASKGVSRPSPRRKHASANRRKASPIPLQLPLSGEGREIVKLLNECRAADAAQRTFGSSNRDASRLQKRPSKPSIARPQPSSIASCLSAAAAIRSMPLTATAARSAPTTS